MKKKCVIYIGLTDADIQELVDNMTEHLSCHPDYQNNPEKISRQMHEYYTKLKNRQQHCLKYGEVEIQEVELTDNEQELEEEMSLFEHCLPGFKYWVNEDMKWDF